MVIDYLKKACKYIYGNRVLMIVCVFAVFFVVANLATYISSYEYENFYGSCTKKHNSTEQFANVPLTVARLKNSNNTNPNHVYEVGVNGTFQKKEPFQNGPSKFMIEQMKNMGVN